MRKPANLASVLAFLALLTLIYRAQLNRERRLVACGELDSYSQVAVSATVISHHPPKFRLQYGGLSWLFGAEIAQELKLGSTAKVRGKLFCRQPYRNPSRLDLGRAPTRLFGKLFAVSAEQTTPKTWMHLVDRFLFVSKDLPGVQRWVHAVWKGSTHQMPTYFFDFYKASGLLHVIALSGQHVVILTVLLSFIIQLSLRLCPFPSQRVAMASLYLRFSMPLLAGVILCLTGAFCGSVVRATIMAGVWVLVRVKGLKVNCLQMALTSAAVILLNNWGRAFDLGFCLSVIATALLLPLVENAPVKRKFWFLCFILLTMPILLYPVTAYFFGEISIIAPVTNLLLGWLWDLILIPIGFVLPLIHYFLPDLVLPWFERAWIAFELLHQTPASWIKEFQIVVPRPTFFELIFVEAILIYGALKLKKRLFHLF